MTLFEAVRKGNLEEVKRLLSEGADVHYENNFAIKSSCYFGHLEVVKLLVEHGANFHDDNDKAVKLANDNGHKEIVNYLNKQMMLDKLKEFG
jgi:ankyrin repeat protein